MRHHPGISSGWTIYSGSGPAFDFENAAVCAVNKEGLEWQFEWSSKSWREATTAGGNNGAEMMEKRGAVDYEIREGLNEPPMAYAIIDRRHTVRLTDPDPALIDVDRMPITLVEWRDRQGQIWQGGLVLPSR